MGVPDKLFLVRTQPIHDIGIRFINPIRDVPGTETVNGIDGMHIAASPVHLWVETGRTVSTA